MRCYTVTLAEHWRDAARAGPDWNTTEVVDPLVIESSESELSQHAEFVS